MKKILLLTFLLFLVCTVYGDTQKSNLALTISPSLGHYHYFVVGDEEISDEYEGGLNLLYIEYEYRIINYIGIIGYTEFTGHLYEGHENSSSDIYRIWGLVNFKIGGGVSAIYTMSDLELRLSTKVYYALYVHDLDETWPGIGLSANIGASYSITSWFSAGITGFINKSGHDGGPVPDEPGVERNPFEIIEYGVGITAKLYF